MGSGPLKKKVKMDLTQGVPRGPREKLGGLVHLGRMIDKARAKVAETLGEYMYPCPLDQSLLSFLGLSADNFLVAICEQEDGAVVQWLRVQGHLPSAEKVEVWNQTFLSHSPDSEDSRSHFLQLRHQIAPDRLDVTAWVDLLDLDEGRVVPVRTPS